MIAYGYYLVAFAVGAVAGGIATALAIRNNAGWITARAKALGIKL